MSEPTLEALPPRLRQIVEDFQLAEGRERLQLLLEYAMELPEPPDGLQPETMEQVHECQTPFFLSANVDADQVTFYYDVPMEAPTIRGYAAILSQGLNGESPQTIVDLHPQFYTLMGLNAVMSPLRLRGMDAVLTRMKRQMKEHLSEA